MKQLFFYLSFLSSIIFISCNTKEKQIKEINSMAIELDSVLRISEVLPPAERMKADELVEKYLEYTEQFPEDSVSPVYLVKASFVAGAIPDPKQQIELLDMVIDKYPTSEYAPQALALAAKVNADHLHNLSEAREYLTRLQNEYPNSPYSVNIDLQIEYAGDDDALFEATMRRKAELDSINAVKKGTGQ